VLDSYSYIFSSKSDNFEHFYFIFWYRPDEAELFAKSAQNAYKGFRDKAALSRSMTVCSKFIIHVPFCSFFLIDMYVTTTIMYLGGKDGGGSTGEGLDR
jgi:hypothetical protein